MKRIALILLLLPVSIVVFAQTLKITSLEVSDPKNYNYSADKSLGKDVIIIVYDNSLSLKFPSEAAVILRQTSDNEYTRVISDNNTEIETCTVIVNKTLSLITSAEITDRIDEKVGQHRTAWWKYIAKRF